MSARTERERDELRLAAIAELLPLIRRCSRGHAGKPIVYANVTSVARSGMSRTITFHVVATDQAITRDPDLWSITHLVSVIGGYRQTGKGLQVGGCDVVAHRLGLGNGNDIDIRSI